MKSELHYVRLCANGRHRNEDIFVLTIFASFFADVLLFEKKERAKFLDENWILTSRYLKRPSLISAGAEV